MIELDPHDHRWALIMIGWVAGFLHCGILLLWTRPPGSKGKGGKDHVG